ncbi:sensor domain-containing diguanylate cyclase [Ammoniphilus sp. CFH 90114]|uniref:sensor domain-containing diguanylate cyclase n=1 Tax=Ammoniphilus sp. CFH 90114 TaxID=2493665 RepID=UPI00100F7CAC|nr:diguanylate cyclase [Ammoniphilus sp. CFH 90114]RXT13506.1 sensor domain-containing diguanylate cyclase [Ammoniphilus sp. CFH 90114]
MNAYPDIYSETGFEHRLLTKEEQLVDAFKNLKDRVTPERFIASSGFFFLINASRTVINSTSIGPATNLYPLEELKWDGEDLWFQVIHAEESAYSVATAFLMNIEEQSYHIGIQGDGIFPKEAMISFLQGFMVSIDVQLEQMRTHEMLFHITKKIHSSIDVDEVLPSIVNNIRMLFPTMKVDLWLSHDSSTTMPFKTFNFNMNEDEVSLRAFMEGKVIIREYDQSENGRRITLAAPLRGKQGIYGILEMYSDQPVQMTSKDIEYITILADTAGNAFENAQLYQQSQKLIRELLLINGMAKQLNRSLNLKDILQFVLDKLMETYHAEYCVILQRIPQEENFTVLASTNADHNGLEVPATDGELAKILHMKEAVILSDYQVEEDGSTFLMPFRSLLGVPLFNGQEIEGAIFVSDCHPNSFTFDDFKLLEILAQHVNMAIRNASLHNEVERMVITDTLTDLYNRKFLNDHVSYSVKQDKQGALILMDIDYFKRVNDTYGHQVGDEILIQVSEIIKTSVRKTDIASRWGGEELAVYLPGQTLETALEVSERIRSRIEHQTKPKVTISLGIAAWREDLGEETVESLFNSADMALYEAKRNGRNQCRVAGI